MLEDETIKLSLTGLMLLMNHFPKRQIKEKRSNNRVCVLHSKYYTHWVVPEKMHTPPQRKFRPSGRGGEKKLFLIIVNVLGHPKGVGGLTSYFLSGGGMDFFWNDPFFF
jgi:hypothetical protein